MQNALAVVLLRLLRLLQLAVGPPVAAGIRVVSGTIAVVLECLLVFAAVEDAQRNLDACFRRFLALTPEVVLRVPAWIRALTY